MNLIPSIANYFGVSIDELFGYTNDRTKRIDVRPGAVIFTPPSQPVPPGGRRIALPSSPCSRSFVPSPGS